MGISPKVKVLLEFEFAYYDITVHHMSHYTIGIPHVFLWVQGSYKKFQKKSIADIFVAATQNHL